jgi:hypothetical protein
MRSAEFIEHTARAFADSWRTDLAVKLIYNSELDVVWNNIDKVAERVVNATYNISTSDIPWAPAVNHRSRMLFAPLFFNTFKDKKINKEETDKKDNTKWNDDLKDNNDKDKKKLFKKSRK